MASEYTEHFNLDLYTDNDRPNLRDQYNAAIRKIDNKMFDQVTTINLLDSVVDNLKEDVEQMQTDLTNEVTARTNADTALGTRIDNEATARESADQTLTTDLATEVTARQGADTTLDNKITAEVTARTNADTALGDRIDDVVTSVTTLTTSLADEVTARTNADTALGERIDSINVKRNIIVIGDSYLQDPTPLINSDVVAKCNANYIKTILDYGGDPGGNGFLTNDTFNGQVNTIGNAMSATERAGITDVVFAGGWNDGNHFYDSESTNDTKVRTAINNARTHFPNARILVYYMYCGYRDCSQYHNGRRRNFAKAAVLYKRMAKAEGCGFAWCNSAPYITDDGATRDGIHPNNTGINYLRNILIALVNNGSANDYLIGEDGYSDLGDLFHSRVFRANNWTYNVDEDKQVSGEFYNANTVASNLPYAFQPIIGRAASGQALGWIAFKVVNNHLVGNVPANQGDKTFVNGTMYFLNTTPRVARYDPNYDITS